MLASLKAFSERYGACAHELYAGNVAQRATCWLLVFPSSRAAWHANTQVAKEHTKHNNHTKGTWELAAGQTAQTSQTAHRKAGSPLDPALQLLEVCRRQLLQQPAHVLLRQLIAEVREPGDALRVRAGPGPCTQCLLRQNGRNSDMLGQRAHGST